jgi:hypothetical protein
MIRRLSTYGEHRTPQYQPSYELFTRSHRFKAVKNKTKQGHNLHQHQSHPSSTILRSTLVETRDTAAANSSQVQFGNNQRTKDQQIRAGKWSR